MINRLIGNYMVGKNKISASQLSDVLDAQKKVRVKLGLIAVAEKMMTPDQADEINRLQAVMDKRFGELAVSKGYLTDEQVSRLLKLQGNAYLSFAQAISDCGIMELSELEEMLEEYRKENGFTVTDLDALKSGEADRIVPLFLPSECDELIKEHIGVAVRTIIRLIDSDICIGKAEYVNNIKADTFALQSLDGDHKASLGFLGNGDSLLAIAKPFADEDFAEADLDALDAVAEFTNCINGLFASAIASKTFMDMLPPSYNNGGVTVHADKILVLPVYLKDTRVELIASFDEMITY